MSRIRNPIIPPIIILLGVALLVRILAFFLIDYSFTNDVRLFQHWAELIHLHGFGAFFELEGQFSDYPPVYMYVLYVTGWLRYTFNWMPIGHINASTVFEFLIFFPAMLADIGVGFMLYIVAKKATENTVVVNTNARKGLRQDKRNRRVDNYILLLVAFWVFNPAIILISSVWGQVESVFTLMLLISLFLLRDKKLFLAYILFGIAILTKPQSLFLGPVYLYSAIKYIRDNALYGRSNEYNYTKPNHIGLSLPKYLYAVIKDFWARNPILALLSSIVSAIAVMTLVSLPFGVRATIDQLFFGMGQHNQVSVNAFNIWAFFGSNRRLMDTQWGHTFMGLPYLYWGIAIALIVIAVALIALYIDDTKHDGKHFYLIVASIFILIFVFSVRMHERYMFPGLLFLILYYWESVPNVQGASTKKNTIHQSPPRDERIKWLYVGFSTTFFINCIEVLRWLRGGFNDSLILTSLRFVSLANIVFAIMLIKVVYDSLTKTEPLISTQKSTNVNSSRKQTSPTILEEITPPPMQRRDWALLIALVIVCSVISFARLGNINSPQTAWTMDIEEALPTAHVDMGDTVFVSRFQFMMGARNDTPFDLHLSTDGLVWELVHTVNESSVFAWAEFPINRYARYFVISPRNHGLRLQEAAFRGADGELLSVTSTVTELFDEQHLVPEFRTFMNSSYFDEIYHPRTGYEFVHGLTVFEWTHPPMGKNLIALSVRLFGMTPFAWRLPGTLFGVLMIPLLYFFAREMFKSNNFALFAAFIFTFDFMRFAQTRLATIDTYVTFFVIAMFFCMYMYIKGLDKNSLTKSLVLLGLCGAAMGLAIASKWQGVYAAIGLPILFFPALYKLYYTNKRQAIITFASCFGLFIALPLVIYMLSYIPFVRASGGVYYVFDEELWQVVPAGGAFRIIWSNQLRMFGYHAGDVLLETHPFSSDWWEWPLMIRPLWLYVTRLPSGLSQGMSTLGNPAVWWFGIFATFFAAYMLVKKHGKEYNLIFLFVAYAVQFVPWMFISRITFIYHYFPSVPFVVLIITWFFKNHVKDRRVIFAYVVIVVVLFVVFYPVLAGVPISTDFVQRLRWLPGWQLV